VQDEAKTQQAAEQKIVIGNADQVGDYTIVVNGRRYNAFNDGKFHRAGIMRAKTAQDLASSIAKMAK